MQWAGKTGSWHPLNSYKKTSSEHFRAFVNYCTIAFCILRRHANLITNLFSLMLDAAIPDIAIERDKAVMKVFRQKRFPLISQTHLGARTLPLAIIG